MPNYTPLSDTLSGLYYNMTKMESLLQRAGFRIDKFNLTASAYDSWPLAVKLIVDMGELDKLLDAALADFPNNPVLLDYKNRKDVVTKSVYAGDKANWVAATTKEDYEKITGEQSTLLPYSFFEQGMIKGKAVARVVTPAGMGSGFLISEDSLFLTNNHVFPAKEIAEKSKVQFNYQLTLSGLPDPAESFDIVPSSHVTDASDDWAVVKLAGDPAKKYGYLKLTNQVIAKDDFVNIIQHPGGEYKQIGLYHNLVTFVDANRVQYLTDTMPGSSGSPVFNSKWNVVALHHSGGFFPEPGTNNKALRNEGININKVIASLKANGYTL